MHIVRPYTKKELVKFLKTPPFDLNTLTKAELDAICQQLGLSGRGSRDENIKKIKKALTVS